MPTDQAPAKSSLLDELLEEDWFKNILKYGSMVLGVLATLETLSNLPETISKYKTFFPILGHVLFQLIKVPLEALLLFAIVFIVLMFVGAMISTLLGIVSFGFIEWDVAGNSFLAWVSIAITAYLMIHYGLTGTFEQLKGRWYDVEDQFSKNRAGFHKCLAETGGNEAICYGYAYYRKSPAKAPPSETK